MKDTYNREIQHIRLSVTSKCNFKCFYCDNEGYSPKGNELTVEEITKLSKILAEILKVTRIKLTGGEPLCRKEIIQIVKNISDLGLYKDISMTTNGYFLYEMAENLYNAGLNRVNVSLCSLKPDVFRRISGSDSLDKVLRGLDKAKEVGFFPIKLNFVLLKGINTNEIEDMIEFCSETGFILQIIELHPVLNHMGNGRKFYDRYHFDLDPLIKNLESKALNTIMRAEMQNRKVFVMSKSIIIETVRPEHKFCLGCTKLRIGCDGNLFGCLYRSDLGINIKSALNNNHSLSEYETILKEVVDTRKPYYEKLFN